MSKSDRAAFGEWVEAYVDGDLSPEMMHQFEEAVRAEPALHLELEYARELRDRLRALPEIACPPDVTHSILAYAQQDVRRAPWRRIRWAVTSAWATALRPALSVGILIGVVVTGTLLTRPSGDSPQPVAVSDEVEQALMDAKWTLAFVSDIGRRTATSIRQEVLEERLIVPLNRAIGAAALNDEQAVQQ